jgi:hypothetical protein
MNTGQSKLMPEYSVDVPLSPGGAETDDLVPPELLQHLVGWQELFDESFHYAPWLVGRRYEGEVGS